MTPSLTDAKPRRASRRTTVVVVSAVAGVLVGLLLGACCVLRSCTPGALEVRVVDGNAPVAGAMVSVRGTTWFGETFPVHPSRGDGRADGQGVVVFEDVDSDAYEVFVGHDDFVFHEEKSVRVPGGERLVHVVALRRGVRVHGRVLGPTGAPMADVELRTFAERRSADRWVTFDDVHSHATTGADGTFLTHAVAPGNSLMLRVHEFRDGRAIVAQGLVPSPRVGVNEAGDIRVLDTVTVLRLTGEPVRDELRAHGAVAATAPDGAPWAFEFANWYFAKDGTAPVVGLPDGELRWRLIEARLGPEPNQILVGEGTAELVGPRREVAIRRTSAAK